MAIEDGAGEINNVVGSTHLFATVAHEILESQLWCDTVGRKVSLTQLRLLKLLGLWHLIRQNPYA